jgi:hypothetical protein
MAKQSNNFSKEFDKIFKGNLGFEEQVDKVKETIGSISKSQIKINNNQALKNISETQKALNQIKQNVVIVIGAKNSAKDSINSIKTNLKSIVGKPVDVDIKAKDQTKGVINGIKKNILSLKNIVLGDTSKKIFNSTMGEAMKTEDSFTSFKTNFKNEKNANSAFEWANNEANNTQFKASEVSESVAKLAASGLDYKKYFTPLGNFATANNKSMNEAIEAMSKLSGGNLKEATSDFTKLGITKDMWQKQGIKLDKDGTIQGDSKQAMEAAVKIMDSNWNGAMKNKSNTASGQIKNMKESFAGLGASLVGVKDNGEIEKGGAFDTFKQQLSKILPLLDAFKKSDAFKLIQKDLGNLVAGAGSRFSALIEKLMKDPDKLKKQFDKLIQSIHSGISVIVKLGSTLSGLIIKLKPLFDIMAKHPKTVIGLFAAFKIGIPIISSIVAAFVKFNAIKENLSTLKNSIKLFCDGSRSMLTGFFKLIAANPVVAAILAIIVVAVLLYETWKNNWGGIRDKTKIVIDFVKERINSIIEVFERVQESVDKFVEYISSKWSDLTFVFSHPIEAIVNIKETGTVKGKKKEGNNALGTSYWHGGWTWVENCPVAEKLAA